MGKIRTFYDELGVGRNAGTREIRRAFRKIAKRYHPDMNPPEKQEWAHERMSRLNFILETLLDSETRKEYNALVDKYERGSFDRPRQSQKQEYALQREYAQVFVEIMNLSGRYANCRLKILLGTLFSSVSILAVLAGSLASIGEMYLAFGRFFVLVGVLIAGIGVSDYMGRSHYRKRIEELEARQTVLRRRMYEAWTTY